MFADNGTDIDVLMYSNQIHSIYSMLSLGDCGAFLFRDLIEPGTNFCSIPLEPKIDLSVGLVWKKNQPMHSYMQQFIRYTKAQAVKN